MSTVTAPHEAAVTSNGGPATLLLDLPGADIILCSQDSYHFQVSKIYIVNVSPILDERIGRSLGDHENPKVSLPVVQLPESGEILHYLLTFIFPITQLVPSTPEKLMELLSVAQRYQMGTVLAHIRGIARQNSLPTRLESLLHIYALAQKYGLRQEALQAARAIFLKYSMTIEDFDDNLGIVSGASLYELWKFHQSVRAILASDLTSFRKSCAGGTITDLRCTELSPSQIPRWLDQYIKSIGENPSLFDSTEFSLAMARHIKDKANKPGCKCASIPSYTMRGFWEALASVVDGSFDEVGDTELLCRAV
jgi:BTB/POZ domain